MAIPFPTQIVIATVVLITTTVLSTLLRFWAKQTRGTIYNDDWALLGALIFTISYGALTIWGAIYVGFGLPLAAITDHDTAVTFGKCLLASELLWIPSVCLVKISILLFYKRIFITRGFVLCSNLLVGVIIVWAIIIFFMTTFATTPVGALVGFPHFNFNFAKFLNASVASGVILDLATLFLPLAMVRTLHTTSRTKLYLTGIISLGFLCIVSSILRLVYVVGYTASYGKPSFMTSNAIADLTLWSMIEPFLAILAANLPTYGPLIRDDAFRQSFLSLKNLLHSFSTRGSPSAEHSTLGSKHKTLQQESEVWQKLDSQENNQAWVDHDLEMIPMPDHVMQEYTSRHQGL